MWKLLLEIVDNFWNYSKSDLICKICQALLFFCFELILDRCKQTSVTDYISRVAIMQFFCTSAWNARRKPATFLLQKRIRIDHRGVTNAIHPSRDPPFHALFQPSSFAVRAKRMFSEGYTRRSSSGCHEGYRANRFQARWNFASVLERLARIDLRGE